MIHHRPEFPARIMTITLQGAAVPFARTLRFNPDLPCGDLMNRICVALGRYPAPGAVVHRDGAYTGRDGAHFPHPDLDESPLCGTLPAGPDSFEFVLDRLRGWVFDVRVREEHDHPVPLSEDVEADEGPLLPRPAMSLTEYNAVMRARGGQYLPPDVERAVAEDGLFDLMDPEVAAPREAMALYTAVARRGQPFALPDVEPLMRARPDLPVLTKLIRLAAGDDPPRLGRHGYMPVKQVRKLVEEFPALHPGHYGHPWGPGVNTASEVTMLSGIIELGRTVGVFTARRGEAFELTDFGEQVNEYCGAARMQLTDAVVGARLGSVPGPVGGPGDVPGEDRAGSFREYLDRRERRAGEIQQIYHLREPFF